ncbi:MAG TPA: nuclease-related domain-containing protein [Woeseiaceae bacterium]|nr:nuclease-related domain-containing protein [Woeseiaceae bacterium]
MNIEAVSGAATVAIACTFVFLLAAKSWHLVARSMSAHPNFPDAIMREAAQRFRDELEALSRKQSAYLGAGLMFVFIFAVAHTFEAHQLFEGYPAWQLYLLLGTLIAAAGFALYSLVCTVRQWRQVRFLRDANIAVGHSLQRIAVGHGRVFHDVVTPAGVVDHIILGPGGIYAVNVVAYRALRRESVRLADGELRFKPDGKCISIADIASKTTRLEQEFRDLLRNSVRVRSVIAVPGWHAESQTGNGHLVVNERTLPMLRGWRDEADYLMDEDVETLQQHLTKTCKRSPAARRKKPR